MDTKLNSTGKHLDKNYPYLFLGLEQIFQLIKYSLNPANVWIIKKKLTREQKKTKCQNCIYSKNPLEWLSDSDLQRERIPRYDNLIEALKFKEIALLN